MLPIKDIIEGLGAVFKESYDCFLRVVDTRKHVHIRFMRTDGRMADSPYTYFPLSRAKRLLKRAKKAYPRFFEHPAGTALMYRIYKLQDTAEIPEHEFKNMTLDGLSNLGKGTDPIIIELIELIVV